MSSTPKQANKKSGGEVQQDGVSTGIFQVRALGRFANLSDTYVNSVSI
jgi:hypothetical protein